MQTIREVALCQIIWQKAWDYVYDKGEQNLLQTSHAAYHTCSAGLSCGAASLG